MTKLLRHTLVPLAFANASAARILGMTVFQEILPDKIKYRIKQSSSERDGLKPISIDNRVNITNVRIKYNYIETYSSSSFPFGEGWVGAFHFRDGFGCLTKNW